MDSTEIHKIIKDYYEQLYVPRNWITQKKWVNS